LSSEDSGLSGHSPRFNFPRDTNKQLGLGASHEIFGGRITTHHNTQKKGSVYDQFCTLKLVMLNPFG